MKRINPQITLFEHECLRTDKGRIRLTQNQLKALQCFYGEKGVPYFTLIHNGIKFSQFVGVIQVGNTVIEILPKADKNNNNNAWRKVLIGMLHSVSIFDIHAPSKSNLQLQTNTILDLYFELLIQELEYLLHGGLIKKYRNTEGNTNTLKGSIQFGKHINKNLIHREKFYISYSTYDKEHLLHSILFKALKLLKHINTNSKLSSRLNALMLDFPKMKDIKISQSIFDRIVLDRKSEPYKNALQISRLILLNYHPDVSQGTNDVLALMFNMNTLWEQFVYASLRKHKTKGTSLIAQNSRNFWKPTSGYQSKIKPDIILNKDKGNCVVLDTKWKNLSGKNPSSQDLRQMFVYMKYYNARKVALIYPGTESKIMSGTYYQLTNGLIGNEECSTISSLVNENVWLWQKQISNQIIKWCESNQNEEE